MNGINGKYIGTVAKKSMEKTGLIFVDNYHYNSKYKIKVRSKTKIYFHDPAEETHVGDVIQVRDSGRKISKIKNFTLDKIVRKNPVIAALQHQGVQDPSSAVQKLEVLEQSINDPMVRVPKQHPERDLNRKQVSLEDKKSKYSKAATSTTKKQQKSKREEDEDDDDEKAE